MTTDKKKWRTVEIFPLEMIHTFLSPSIWEMKFPDIINCLRKYWLVITFGFDRNSAEFSTAPENLKSHFVTQIIMIVQHIVKQFILSEFNIWPCESCEIITITHHKERETFNQSRELTLPHCLHLPFSVLRWTQWWCVLVCSRYWRTPTSRNVGLHANWEPLSTSTEIQLAWAMILHAEHFILGPCF